MQRLRIAITIALASGCYSAEPAATRVTQIPPQTIASAGAEPSRSARLRQRVLDMCPLRVPNATVAMEHVDDGGALAFRTTTDVSELRRRVRAMADVHDHYRDEIAGVLRTQSTLDAAHRYVEDLPEGARIVFKPTRDLDVHTYRQSLASEAVRLRGGDCPMVMPPRAESSGLTARR